MFTRISKSSNLFKTDVSNVIIAPVLVPDVEDRNEDVISKQEIIKTAYEFIQNIQSKTINKNHEENSDIEGCYFVESFIVSEWMTKQWVMKMWDMEVPVWTWVVWMKVTDEVYKQALDGEITSISMEWVWTIEQLN